VIIAYDVFLLDGRCFLGLTWKAVETFEPRDVAFVVATSAMPNGSLEFYWPQLSIACNWSTWRTIEAGYFDPDDFAPF
jgi:hypothetical protein